MEGDVNLPPNGLGRTRASITAPVLRAQRIGTPPTRAGHTSLRQAHIAARQQDGAGDPRYYSNGGSPLRASSLDQRLRLQL